MYFVLQCNGCTALFIDLVGNQVIKVNVLKMAVLLFKFRTILMFSDPLDLISSRTLSPLNLNKLMQFQLVFKHFVSMGPFKYHVLTERCQSL